MSCPCGGETALTTLKRAQINASLQLMQCRACGRVGNEHLFINGTVVLREASARAAFRNITAEQAKSLWDQHQEGERQRRLLAQEVPKHSKSDPKTAQFALF